MLSGMEIGYPDLGAQPLLGSKNLRNTALVLLVPLPAILVTWLLFHWFPVQGLLAERIPAALPFAEVDTGDELAAWMLHHPVATANILYFVFIDGVFFAVALVQRSSWLIDPYWTLLPILLAWYYLAHPLADPSWTRVALAWTALIAWSARLTYNYFRRESWRFGLREDWRYAEMRRERPHFWLEQFFVVYLAQHAMLLGLSLPFWALAFRPVPTGAADVTLFALAIFGIGIARAADTQLDHFMRENAARTARGDPKVWLLDSGIWRYSRHPNYFGEQLFWWSIAGFGLVCGEPWVMIGTAINSCVLAGVTVMTERRMLDIPERREAYAAYRARTSVWIPWPPRDAEADPGGE